MKTYLKLEFKKNILSWRTIISILIILALFIIPYVEEIKFSYPGVDGIDYFIRIHQFSYICFIAPIIAGFIYSTSIIRDKESGFLNKLLEIIDIKTYFKVKLLVNALINSIVFTLSYGIFILYFVIIFGINNEVGENIRNGVFIMRAFIGLYETSKILYIIIILLGTVLSSIAFSTFMIGLTTAIGRKCTTYIFPIFYVILTGVFFKMWGLNNIIDFDVIKLFILTRINDTDWIGVMLYNLILIIFGVVLLYKFGYKRILDLSGVKRFSI
ncbi:hypothetical protein [Clostridium weizhouense]|uniref:ABC transporter permease n=1 Tax=Clostridium weizhouense TaxID=2859781 RepID=A0ABS7AL00_9CLOT|nr:hypothetical protein [Clostridium weizhouense]MBW6409344.1 hypothetical protein [Clostridium weizhouense]